MIVRALPVALAGALLSCQEAGDARPVRDPGSLSPLEGDRASALALDRDGARAYTEGRYADAILYFEAAYRLGAPPVELWNVARCHLKVGDGEAAARFLQRYLDEESAHAPDRRDAERALRELTRKPAPLTLTSAPSGASVRVDGHAVSGKTPTTVWLRPGEHEVEVRFPKDETARGKVTAQWGRPMVVHAIRGRSGLR